MAEGDTWKNKRKILSTVFNYDFILRQIPKIHEITKKTLDKYE
jgi:cytochrome P450